MEQIKVEKKGNPLGYRPIGALLGQFALRPSYRCW